MLSHDDSSSLDQSVQTVSLYGSLVRHIYDSYFSLKENSGPLAWRGVDYLELVTFLLEGMKNNLTKIPVPIMSLPECQRELVTYGLDCRKYVLDGLNPRRPEQEFIGDNLS